MTNKQYYGLLGRVATIEKAHESLKGFTFQKLDALEARIDNILLKAEAALNRSKAMEVLCHEIEKQVEEVRQTRLNDIDAAWKAFPAKVDAANKKDR